LNFDILDHIDGQFSEFAKKAESFYQAFFDSNVFAVASLDKYFRITEVNEAFAQHFGDSDIAHYNRDPKAWLENYAQVNTRQLLFKLTSGQVFQQEFTIKKLHGHNVFLRFTFIPVFIEGTFSGVILIGSDISEKKRDEMIQKQLAFYDEMTGLANRRHYFSTLANYINEPIEKITHLHIVAIGLNNLIDLNDYGFHIGDGALKYIGQLLTKSFDNNTFIARISSNEFAIIIENAERAKVEDDIQKLVFTLNHIPHLLYGKESTLDCTVGVAQWPDHGSTAEKLVHSAEKAMISAIHSKMKYRFYTYDMSPLYQLNLEEKIKLAIKEKQFYLVYQPIVQLSTRKIIGYEALIRWQHPEDGIIPPNQFIPLAEQSGIIIEIEKAVLEIACSELKKLDKENPGIFLSINISALHFHQNIVEHIMEAVEREKVNPSQIKIEITETCSMRDPNNTILKLQQLKQLGIRVAIDDFGVGYSSLQYLGNFPADEIKLDQSFINPITPQKTTIINAVMSIARDYKINVVAEGIETEEQLEFLTELDCNCGQGYLLGKPQKMY
jgi:diguanylate cyclase (GGDEF)-like protein/PAS domain S-box-containing protein